MRVKDKKKFFRFLILLTIFIFTISCGVKRLVFNEEPKQPEMVKDEIKVDVLSMNKGNSELELKKKNITIEKDKALSEQKNLEEKESLVIEKSIEKEEIQTKDTNENKEIEKKQVLDDKSDEFNYIKNQTLFVYKDELQKNKIDTLRKGTKVKIIESKEVERDGKKKSLLKISYRKDLKDKIGWISKVDLATTLNEVLPKNWKNLDFETSYPMNNFTNNPRVDVKGIYLNIYTIGSSKKMERLINLAKTTEINAFVIDVKDDNGVLSFEMEAPKKFGIPVSKNYPIKNIGEFMKKLKENNIYAIARIVSFKDPTYAKANPDKVIISRDTGKPYTNSDGIIWVSAHDRNLWEYNLAVAEEAAKAGFNEIQFDYVRFPASNGGKLDSKLNYRNTKNESKPETIQKYLKYARERLNALQVYTSADVYGQVGTFSDDMGLGQHWEAVAQVVDYICPMMYPSHYGNGAYGIPVPDAQPYKTIYHSVKDSVNRSENISSPATMRPWIQAFTAKWVKGHINYNEKEIREQIKAMNDLGVTEYLLWSPSNNYKITGK
ncbi:putative glycoside hydrolase [Candidatus Cetobacterium colombiensis]|uniref:Glycoside hydrolase n=1 Tax=Candidatus Cetobacterium colombiensis TaxID=3073100 RepID=A0ABU4WAP6_9FUSO|nr:putative glycoside hydrolase [Candidatus Cetobacterium colombiensis]MDX8336274.1 putative glycoside hydrolase [Candidatus Cetobacterium colombiensis]